MANYSYKKFSILLPVSHSTSIRDERTDGQTDDTYIKIFSAL